MRATFASKVGILMFPIDPKDSDELFLLPFFLWLLLGLVNGSNIARSCRGGQRPPDDDADA